MWHLLVVGVVSGDPPAVSPPITCNFTTSRSWTAGLPGAPLDSHNMATSSGTPSGFARICRGAVPVGEENVCRGGEPAASWCESYTRTWPCTVPTSNLDSWAAKAIIFGVCESGMFTFGVNGMWSSVADPEKAARRSSKGDTIKPEIFQQPYHVLHSEYVLYCPPELRVTAAKHPPPSPFATANNSPFPGRLSSSNGSGDSLTRALLLSSRKDTN